MKFSRQSITAYYALLSISITTNDPSVVTAFAPPSSVRSVLKTNSSSCAPKSADSVVILPLNAESSDCDSEENDDKNKKQMKKDVNYVDAVVESSSGFVAEIIDEENTSVRYSDSMIVVCVCWHCLGITCDCCDHISCRVCCFVLLSFYVRLSYLHKYAL